MNSFNNFIKKSNIVHNGYYSYNDVNYSNARTKVEITCPKHGGFYQIPYNHLIGKGCNKCSIDRNKLKFTKSLKDFIYDANIVHKNKYNYDGVEYINDSTPINILCNIHGTFSQIPNKHLNGQGCPGCKSSKTRITNIEKHSKIFPIKSNKIHNNFYNYSKVNYISAKIPVEIICPKHGSFFQIPYNHLMGKGCNRCNQSKGENLIELFLIKNNIKYESQKRFNDLKESRLAFDFWLHDHNMLIEFDGIQHFIPIEYFGGEIAYNKYKANDRLKDEYCIQKGIKLLRIDYRDLNNIDYILSKNII